MSQQWNPLQDLVMLQDRMNRLFQDATDRRARTEASDDLERGEWDPAADVYETEAAYIVAVDLPGVDRSGLEISIDEQRLTIRGSRKIEAAAGRKSERPQGRFVRTFTVPPSVDEEGIEAELKDGVLQVHLPRKKEPSSKRVAIKIT